MNKNSCLIRVDSLSKTFYSFTKHTVFSVFQKEKSTAKQVFQNISFDISEGEVVSIVGKNGCGKTTLLKCMCGLLLPTSGTVRIGGVDVMCSDGSFKPRIGFISGNERLLYNRLTVRTSLRFYASLYGMSPREAEQRINQLAALLEIDPYIDIPFYKCSAGMKQRCLIAQGLLHNPDIILLDEPTRSLDASIATEVREIILRHVSSAKNRTVICATHSITDLNTLQGRILLLDQSAIIEGLSLGVLKEKGYIA